MAEGVDFAWGPYPQMQTSWTGRDMQMTISSQAVGAQSELPVLARILRPALGLMVPIGLAVAWEIIVKLGLSTGRLVPPPSGILSTFADLAATGALQRPAPLTLTRVTRRLPPP